MLVPQFLPSAHASGRRDADPKAMHLAMQTHCWCLPPLWRRPLKCSGASTTMRRWVAFVQGSYVWSTLAAGCQSGCPDAVHCACTASQLQSNPCSCSPLPSTPATLLPLPCRQATPLPSLTYSRCP